jgi:hypothetical protein
LEYDIAKDIVSLLAQSVNGNSHSTALTRESCGVQERDSEVEFDTVDVEDRSLAPLM